MPEDFWVTPWRYKDEGGLYIGPTNQMWLYAALPLSPLSWEDRATQISLGDTLASLMTDIGMTSKAPAPGVRQLSKNREVHLVSVRWDEPQSVPGGLSLGMSALMADFLSVPAPRRLLALGVRLWPEERAGSSRSVAQQIKSAATKLLLEDVPDRSEYAGDRDFMEELFARYGARALSRDEHRRLESWFSDGKGAETTVVERWNSLDVPSSSMRLQMAAVMDFAKTSASAPDFQWAMEAISDPDGPIIISVRSELEPAEMTRHRARTSQRKIKATIEEEQATGDLDRPEFSEAFVAAQQFEEYVASSRDPLMSRCSIILGMDASSSTQDFYERLRAIQGIEVKPLEHRQIPALDETLPCSLKRANPFLQDVSISMVAYAGMNGFSNVGDDAGLYVGLSSPDLSPVFLDPMAAAKMNLPAATLIAGDSGSGKSFLAQMLAVQHALSGGSVIFVNPKGYDSLSNMADYCGGQVIRMSALQKTPGAFDPFRYSPPEVAAEIASNHIVSVLGGVGGFTQTQQLELGSALKKAAQVGVRCVGEAFPFITDGSIVSQIRQQMEASSLFALGIALEPLPSFAGTSGLTLVEFDRALDLPDPSAPQSSYTRRELVALAAVRLVTRASMEILGAAGGGMLVLDEAWTFLGFSEGLSALQRLGREGRSLGILPIFATQRVADVLSKDMEAFLSRVFCMKLTDERDATLALQLCGLKPTKARVAWLRNCGPSRTSSDGPARPASALHRDASGRHCAVAISPIPPDLYQALTTNPSEKKVSVEAADNIGAG